MVNLLAYCVPIAYITYMTAHEAAHIWAKDNTPDYRGTALTFDGDVAYSYAEPIAVREGDTLYRTTARFSVTTSRHNTIVTGRFAVMHGSDKVIDIDHGTIREMTRKRGLSVGPRGRRHDAVAS